MEMWRAALKPTDSKADNQSKTDYRNQVNKVANAIKELMVGMQSDNSPAQEKAVPVHKQAIPTSSRKKLSLAAAVVIALGIIGYSLFYFTGIENKFFPERDKSIAVLPFENMNKDSTQDYFSNGIAEDILNHLVKIADLKVKSRTSTLQYKGTVKTMSEIGEELNVGNIVEGSVRRVGNKIRIVVQLIDTETDTHLWSETYDRDLNDVLALQSEIALEIARALEVRLTSGEKKNIEKEVVQNVTAYDYFLKAQEFARRGSGKKADLENALQLANKAIQSDKGFSRAYALKAQLWFGLSYFGVPEKEWYDSVMYNANQAIHFDPASPDGFLLREYALRYIGKINQADAELKKAYSLAPNNPNVLVSYGYLLLREGKEEGADLILKSAENQYSSKDPSIVLSIYRCLFNSTLLSLVGHQK